MIHGPPVTSEISQFFAGLRWRQGFSDKDWNLQQHKHGYTSESAPLLLHGGIHGWNHPDQEELGSAGTAAAYIHHPLKFDYIKIP